MATRSVRRLDLRIGKTGIEPASGSSNQVAAEQGWEEGERGSSLILALVFLIVTSLVVISLANLAKNDLIATTKFKSAQSLDSAADSAAELAVNNIRYNFMPQTLNASPPAFCWTGSLGSQITLNGQTVSVWCSTRWNPLSAKTRVVTFVACPSSTSVLACAVNPLLEGVVTFDDYPSPRGAVSTAQCTSTCGVGMTINSWVFDAVPPTVQSISPTSGAVAGGSTITVTGTGFINGASVNFVDTKLGSNVVLAAANVSVLSSTTLTAVAPALASGASYYVTVSTPIGTSVYGPTYN